MRSVERRSIVSFTNGSTRASAADAAVFSFRGLDPHRRFVRVQSPRDIDEDLMNAISEAYKVS